MNTFNHRPIDLREPTFRLVRLLAGSSVDVNIQCEIINACFDRPEALIPYEALSYTWGSKELVEEIKLDGRLFRVTKNLYIALQYLRFENQDRIMWIDGLCIDQGSSESEEGEERKRKEKEKAQQIHQMGTIYRRAERVIFWLGPATYETNVIMDSMKLLEKKSNKYPRNRSALSDQVPRDVWSTIQPELRRIHSNLEILQRTGLEIIFNRPWFRRVWILQEVANANQAIVVCDTKSVSAPTFALALSLLGFRPETHCQSVVDVMPGSSRKQSWWNENRDLHTLLVKFGKSEATDPRDHIRALLGISSDAGDGALLQPETIQELIKDTASFLLRFPELRKTAFPPDHWTMAQFLESTSSLSSIVLGWAQDTDNIPFIKILLARHDIDVNFKDEEGQTVLSRAVRRQQKEITALLLSVEDINVNVKDNEGRTPLHVAVGGKEVDIVRQLLARDDIDVNLEDTDSNLPFMDAINPDNAQVIELLLGHHKSRMARSTLSNSSKMAWRSETTAIGANTLAKNIKEKVRSLEMIVRELQGVCVIAGSLVDRIDYYGRFMQMRTTTYRDEIQLPIRVLLNTKERLTDQNSMSLSDSKRPASFPKSVYDFIEMRIHENEGEKHRFFVYHPDTDWYPVFHQIIRQKPLPSTFCAKSDDLDKLCQYMQSIRAAIQDENKGSTDVIFHLLIPAWYSISINEPLHFSEALQPFYVEGQKHEGKGLVTLNLPATSRKLLKGVNSFRRSNTTTDIAARVTRAVATDRGVNGACLALGMGLGTVTGLGAVVVVPVWLGSAVVAMATAAEKDHRDFHGSMWASPRILGCNSRLDMQRGN